MVFQVGIAFATLRCPKKLDPTPLRSVQAVGLQSKTKYYLMKDVQETSEVRISKQELEGKLCNAQSSAVERFAFSSFLCTFVVEVYFREGQAPNMVFHFAYPKCGP